MKVIFFGTPQFAADTLQYLLDHGVEVCAVVTKPDRPQGRSSTPVPTPVKLTALAQQPALPVFQPAIVSDPAFAPTLAAFQADLFVVVAYGEIIKQHLLDMPRLGCINVHGSLLPRYRGAAPIQRSIMHGDVKTGITIMHMVKKMDAGDIIEMVEVPVGPDDTFPEVEQALCRAGAQALLQVIHAFQKGKVPRTPQEEALATYAPKIELEDCQLDWNLPAQSLHNLIRGVTPEPGAWCFVQLRGQSKRLKVLRSRVVSSLSGPPGSILSYGKEGLVIACGQQALRILDLQLEGKKAMPAEELMRGFPRGDFSF